MDEFKSFQSGYKKAVRDIVDRPFVSAKMQHKNDFSSHKELVTIKFVFPDYVCVTVSIPTTCKGINILDVLFLLLSMQHLTCINSWRRK